MTSRTRKVMYVITMVLLVYVLSYPIYFAAWYFKVLPEKSLLADFLDAFYSPLYYFHELWIQHRSNAAPPGWKPA